jgi:hypothetical protein
MPYILRMQSHSVARGLLTVYIYSILSIAFSS